MPDETSPFPVAIIDLGSARMQPYHESFYPDRMIVYRLVNVTDSENMESIADGDPFPEIPCAIVDPMAGKEMTMGVDPYGSELVEIYCPVDPQIIGVRQLIEITRARGIVLEDRKRMRTVSDDRIPVGISPYWVVNAKWES